MAESISPESDTVCWTWDPHCRVGWDPRDSLALWKLRGLRGQSCQSCAFFHAVSHESLPGGLAWTLTDGRSRDGNPAHQIFLLSDTLVGSEFPSIQVRRSSNSSSSFLDNPSPRRIKAISLPATRCWGFHLPSAQLIVRAASQFSLKTCWPNLLLTDRIG